jgi:Bacterial Ig-like domain (group 2)/Galactose oxidase, central domain
MTRVNFQSCLHSRIPSDCASMRRECLGTNPALRPIANYLRSRSSSSNELTLAMKNRLKGSLVILLTVVSFALGACGGGSSSVATSSSAPTGILATFRATGSLGTARGGQTATLLNNGMVLIAGGYDSDNSDGVPVASAELYDLATGTFTPTGNLTVGRAYDTATLLNSGMVLIAGGQTSDATAVATAELYNPVSGTFTATGTMSTTRIIDTATLLNDGTVLIAGGNDTNFQTLSSAEIYNPSTGMFTIVGNMNATRCDQTATLLNNGLVLIAGGSGNPGGVLGSAELYDPATSLFTFANSVNNPRAAHTATLLNGGTVLIVGGYDSNGNAVASAELYDPSTGIFSYTGSPDTPRGGHTATLLSNGTVLLAGGYDSSIFANSVNNLSSVELYDSVAERFGPTSNLSIALSYQTATLLSNGTVLVAGGFDDSNNALTNAEIYLPTTLIPEGLISISLSPANPSVSVGTSVPLAATGTFKDGSIETLASVSWSSSDDAIATITADSTNYGHVFAVAPGSATLTACAGSICGSTALTVIP